MKRFFAFILVAATVFQITSCSTKFNIAAPYKNITVAYGLLDMADTAHYIRIEKAFLSQTLSALNMAQTADSSYFDSLVVVMKAINSGGSVDQIIPLYRVDLDLEGYPKDSGTFFTSPNYAYKFKNALQPDHTYRLVISNPSTGVVDSAVSPVINDVDHSVFEIYIYDILLDPTAGLNFAQNNNHTSLDVTGAYTSTPAPVIFQCIFRLRWVDRTSSGQTSRSADYNMGTTTISSTGSYSFSATDDLIYQLILNSMGQAPTGVSRYIDSCDLFVYAGSQDLSTYQQITQSQGTGLTANEIEPNYTNIKGPNVLGLFTARGVRTDRVRVSAITLDSLVQSSRSGYLSGTNIVGSAY